MKLGVFVSGFSHVSLRQNVCGFLVYAMILVSLSLPGAMMERQFHWMLLKVVISANALDCFFDLSLSLLFDRVFHLFLGLFLGLEVLHLSGLHQSFLFLQNRCLWVNNLGHLLRWCILLGAGLGFCMIVVWLLLQLC